MIRKKFKKSTTPIPTTETTNSKADYQRNTNPLIPVEQAILYMILDELKAIKKLLENSR